MLLSGAEFWRVRGQGKELALANVETWRMTRRNGSVARAETEPTSGLWALAHTFNSPKEQSWITDNIKRQLCFSQNKTAELNNQNQTAVPTAFGISVTLKLDVFFPQPPIFFFFFFLGRKKQLKSFISNMNVVFKSCAHSPQENASYYGNLIALSLLSIDPLSFIFIIQYYLII